MLRVIGGLGALDKHKYYKINQMISSLDDEQRVQMLNSKGYNFKFLEKRREVINMRKQQEKGTN